MVQFNFTNETGTWVNVSKYVHPDPSMPSITLLPMIHIGEKEFFKEISLEVWRHDTAFLEGCYMPGRKLFHIFHRTFARFSGLSLQNGKQPLWKRWKRESKLQGKTGLTETIRKTGCHCGNCYYDEMRVIRADLHRWHALKAFRLIPFWMKLTFPFLILAAIVAAPFLNMRDYVFEDDEDCKSKDDGFLGKIMSPFWKFIMDDRDLFLRMIVAEEVLRPRHQGKSLCVKYGAKHMPALAQTFLNDFGYTLASQREVLAVKKTKKMDVTNIQTGYGYASKRYWEEFDAKNGEVKEVITTVTNAETKNFISVKITSPDDNTPIPLTIQTDLKGFVEGLTPASAA